MFHQTVTATVKDKVLNHQKLETIIMDKILYSYLALPSCTFHKYLNLQ